MPVYEYLQLRGTNLITNVTSSLVSDVEVQGYVKNCAYWSPDAPDFRYEDKNGNIYSKTGSVFSIETSEGNLASYDASSLSSNSMVAYTFIYQNNSYYVWVRGVRILKNSPGITSDHATITTYDSSVYDSFISNYGTHRGAVAWLVYPGTTGTGEVQYYIYDSKYISSPSGRVVDESSLTPINLDGVIFTSIENPGNQDPYNQGGTSTTGGGDGTFDRTNDPIPIPDLPSLSSASTGFVSLFNPTLAQLNNLASYMWSDLFDIATFKKIFADPMDVILGLSIVPVAVPSSGTAEVKVGNISTGVSMNKASSQYVQVNCGSFDVGKYWGAYLDYAPYTKAEIYLPYCGTHPIDIDEIMGKTVTVNYNIDILSGACCAMVKCGESVLYHFLGQCSQPIPVSGNDWTSVIANAVRAAASIGTMLATGGLSTPAAAQQTVSGISSTASMVTGMKPSIEKSGSMSGSGGMLGVQTPYLIFSFPRQCLPDKQNSTIGYPSYIYSQFSSLSGYTIVDEVHLSINSATNQEKDEIENLLKTGVIL